MQSLFSKLFKYRERENRSPEEDYMTELIAYIFQHHKSILVSFLKECNILQDGEKVECSGVSTQYVLGNSDSRPDIVIKLTKGNKQQSVIFIENKINAEEGPNQLHRYFTYLSKIKKKSASSCHLVYVTKHYDSKEDLDFLSSTKNEVSFFQLRWWQIYQLLKPYEEVEIIKEVLKFMKERGLSMSRKFNSSDISTLMNMNRVKEMIQESLSGKVEEMFYKISGVRYNMPSADSQLRTTGRYIYMANQMDWFWMGIGYWFAGRVIDAKYPDIGVIVSVKPYHAERDLITNAISEYAINNTLWESFALNNKDEWAGMRKKLSLKEIMSTEDHLTEIQEWYIDALNDLQIFKENNPELPWKVKKTLGGGSR